MRPRAPCGRPLSTRERDKSAEILTYRSASEAEEDEDRAAEADELFVAEPANGFAELGSRNGRDLVDHEAAWLA